MLRIMNTKVYGLEESLIASGYAMRVDLPQIIKEDEIDISNHFKRGIHLGNTETNSGHGNYKVGVIVQCDITYPGYWTPQSQRYHWFQIISSQSKMNKLTKLDFSKCFNKYVISEIINILEKMKEEYNENPTYENYMKLISNCPFGIELTERITTNYMQLHNMYNQRKNHKLKEDWGAFCDWIKSLPYFIELTGIKE